MEMEPMFVDAKKEGCGVVLEPNLLCKAFEVRRAANRERRARQGELEHDFLKA